MSEPVNQPDLSAAVSQLRRLVCGLGVMLFLLSLAFTGFIWKQSRIVSSLTQARRAQLVELKAQVERHGAVMNDILVYSSNRPDLMNIFHNHGIDVKQVPNPATTPAPQR